MTCPPIPLPSVNHELMKAFLFLRTTTIIVTSTKSQIEHSRYLIEFSGKNGDHTNYIAYQNELDSQERDLELWEKRWVEAGVELVNLVAIRTVGRSLPREILGMVEMELRRGEMELAPLW